MASTRTIEDERGTYRGIARRHNGYWAGDFSHRVPATSGATRLGRVQLALKPDQTRLVPNPPGRPR